MPPPTSVDPVATGPQVDDEDEYEYEYSTTETETYYLTLDLSLPDFVERGHDQAPHNRRGGYSVWYNSAYNKSDANPPTAPFLEEEQDADADDGLPPEREDDDEMAAGDPSMLENGTRESPDRSTEVKELGSIQILELHSENPIVLYRNKILRGTWKRNMGTEMIIAAHEPSNPLPRLRSLDKEVDLIAASSARIAFSEVDVTIREKEDDAATTEQDKNRSLDERLKRNNGVFINVTSDKLGDRVPQACFLEDLTALKRKRGEMDDVTIFADDPPPNKATFEDQMHMRRHMRNVKRKQRYRKKKAEVDEDEEDDIAGEEAWYPNTYRTPNLAAAGGGRGQWSLRSASRDQGSGQTQAPQGSGEDEDEDEEENEGIFDNEDEESEE